MSIKRLNKIIQWWVTPKLPIEHIFIPPEKRPAGFYPKIRVYFRKWFVHPAKRRLARYYLKFLQRFFGLTVIGITGSAGKTTTKEMLASILSQQGETVWSFDNIDPVYNIPTSILKCQPKTKYLILEMGVEFPGEMDFYLWLAQPQIGVITNIYQTHTQFLGDISGVAKEKGKLVKSLSKDSTAVLNGENKYCLDLAKKVSSRVLFFGKDQFLQAKNITIEQLKTKYTLLLGKERVDLILPFPGRQFVYNSLAAAAAAYSCEANLSEIKRGIENYTPVEHRMQPFFLKNRALVLDDSYNSNPQAAQAALETLKEVACKKETIAILGDMLELGKDETVRHKELGRLVADFKIDYLIGVSKLARYITSEAKKKMGKDRVWLVNTPEDALPILAPLFKTDTVVLIKGSRSIGLDRLVEALKML